MDLIRGAGTSEGRRSAFVVAASIIMPILGLLCELLLDHKVIDGTVAMATGLVASAIASAGYSHSRATVKRAHMQSEAIKKKPVVLWQEKSKE
jgi:hypothetical protein